MIYLHTYTIDKDIKAKSKELLQANLIHYLKTDKFTITYNDNGKPATQGISLSISHSKNKLVQVFSVDGEIGVDVEYINTTRNFLKLAKRYFHSEEYNTLQSLDLKQAIHLFYDLWTAKEAVCKAQGGRLWFYLNNNFLNPKKSIKAKITGLNILQCNIISNFSVTVVTQSQTNHVILANNYE